MTDENRPLISRETLTESILHMAVESWRFGKVFERMSMRLDAGEKTRFQNQFHWFIKSLKDALSDAGLTLVNVEEQPYDPGIAASPINIGDFETGDSLVVDQMLEPIIVDSGGVVKTGTVTLRKVIK